MTNEEAREGKAMPVETAFRKRVPNWPYREPSWFEKRSLMLIGSAAIGWLHAIGILAIGGRKTLTTLNVMMAVCLVIGWYCCYYAANSFVRSGNSVAQRHFASIHNLKYVGAGMFAVFVTVSGITPMHELAGPFTALVLLLVTSLFNVTIHCDVEDARAELSNMRKHHSREIDLQLESEDIEGQWYMKACPQPLVIGAALISCAYVIAGPIAFQSLKISNPLFGPSMFFLTLASGVWVSSTFFSFATYQSISGEYLERYSPIKRKKKIDVSKDAKAWRKRHEAGQKSKH